MIPGTPAATRPDFVLGICPGRYSVSCAARTMSFRLVAVGAGGFAACRETGFVFDATAAARSSSRNGSVELLVMGRETALHELAVSSSAAAVHRDARCDH